MFRRSVLCLSGLCLGWLFVSGVVMGQDVTHLKLQPDRLRHAREAERQAIAASDSLQLAEAWYLYGKTYVFAGDYQTSQRYFLKSMRILESRGDSDDLARIYVRLSENEGRLGRENDALRYANLSMQMAQRIQSDKELVRAYGAIGRAWENLWKKQPSAANRMQFKNSLVYYRKQEALCYKLKDSLGIAEATLQLGTLFTQARDPQAIPYLEKALSLFVLLHENRLRTNVMLHLAAAYLEFGKQQMAFQTLLKAEQLYNANRVDEYDTRLDLEKEFVRYYQTTGQWKEAFDHVKKQSELEKIGLLSDRDGKIAQLNVAYESEKKEALIRARNRELALSAQTLHTQQRFTLATSTLFIVTAGMSVVFFRLYRKNQRISRRNETLVREQNHRVKNNLQVISSLLNLQSRRLSDEAARTAVAESLLRVQSMAIVHRRLYDGGQLAEVNLSEFIQELVESVLKTYGHYTVQTSFDIDDISLSADKAVPLGLILNELTTNACKYAFPHSAGPRFSVVCYRKHAHLTFIVKDNGPGLAGSELNDSMPGLAAGSHSPENGSFGMQLIQAQARQLRGTHKFRSDGGVLFTLEFTI
ncbi:tetratricopeptide repeat protein [Spirosoma taeanense]|uniref:histidine kinase n=1 Tax=Spirosoma taeanense TaxID=2735870 RepID=A0A6M5Y7C6_9BACT|nr:histidine kinase dimerization/phosphoacceptor domain -containing protein [Spirosoma taeanense]QJW89240.1 tetratricopeptide repeat protein [Spirosoma taeanense]